MKKFLVATAAAGALFALSAGAAFADSISTNFESFSAGNVNQNGWTMSGPYDVSINDNSTGAPVSFGTRSLRISDAVTSGSFGDWLFAAPLTNAVGESDSTDGTFSAGTLQPHFEMQFDIDATTSQPGLFVSTSPDRGDGSRMSYLGFSDTGSGIDVIFYDVQGTSNPANFVETDLGTYPYGVHTVKLTMDMYNGPSNDVVKVWIDGVLVHTGTSWENYYRYDSEASAEQSPRIVKTVIFQARGTAHPADAGKGYLIDNFSMSSGPIPVPSVTTEAATNVTPSDATMNAMNGPVSAVPESFWVSTSPINTSSPNIPAGVYSTPVLSGTVTAGGTFQDQLSLVTTNGIVTGGNPGNMPAITPGTTYYYVAWINVDGTWYPGNQESVTIPTPGVTTNSATAETTSGATLNGTVGSTNADNTSFWWGTTVPATPINVPGPNPAATSEFPAGWHNDSGLGSFSANAPFSENIGSLTPGATYYFVAWVEVGGIWYPGQTLSFVVPMSAGSCPAGTVQAKTPLETVSVNSSSDTPTMSTHTLANGTKYVMVASGTWQNGGLNVVDPMYASLDSWTHYQEGYDTTPYFLGPEEFNLELNGAFTDWGPYSTGHAYPYLYTGTGSKASFLVFDGDSNSGASSINPSWYGDNSGTLSVAIYQCAKPSTVTVTNTNSGTVTVTTTSSSNSGGNVIIGSSNGGSKGTGGNTKVTTGKSSSNSGSVVIVNTNVTTVKGKNH